MKHKLNLIQKLGLLLILISLCLVLGSELLTLYSRSQAERIANRIEAMLPRKTTGSPEEFANSDMPVLQLDGKDFSGLIQVPAFGIRLPIGSAWDNASVLTYPCRFWGSVYDNSLIVGAGSEQFAFCGRLDLGDRIVVTDMTGAQFAYEVTRTDRRSHADMQVFQETDSDLTLFVRDDGTLDYIIVRCAFTPLPEMEN